MSQNYLENLFPLVGRLTNNLRSSAWQILSETIATTQTTEEEGAQYFRCLEATGETAA
jgi:hypothetical protein